MLNYYTTNLLVVNISPSRESVIFIFTKFLDFQLLMIIVIMNLHILVLSPIILEMYIYIAIKLEDILNHC